MISMLYRGKYTCIIEVKPCHDDTTSDEKYEFTYSVVFSATEPSWKGLISVTEKAFDTVWRDGLWYKLLMCNIKGKMYNVILNPYNNEALFQISSHV